MNDWQGATGPDLYPLELRKNIDDLNAWIYDDLSPSEYQYYVLTHVDNGVYRCGFAQKQASYDVAVRKVFAALDRLEVILKDRDYLVGSGRGTLTEADVRLFPTLARFEAYHHHFHVNFRQLTDYPELTRYRSQLWRIPAFREVTKPDHHNAGYAQSMRVVMSRYPNSEPIVPIGPERIEGFGEWQRRIASLPPAETWT